MKTIMNNQKTISLKGILFVLFFGVLLLGSCEKEESVQEESEELTSVAHKWRKKKIRICHSGRNGHCRIIKVSKKAWKAHKRHGDVRLDDRDGDGYVPDNACGYGQMGDCDDKDPLVNPGIAGSCGDEVDSDGDGDGVPDSEDECPDEVGLPAFNGCPDADGDGVADKDDECPTEAGPADNDGCPNIELSDYEVLRILYEANPDNTLSWDLADTSMESWTGVQLNGDGEVIILELTDGSTPANLTSIPMELGMLNSLEVLFLGGGFNSVPKELGLLSNLKTLYLAGVLTGLPPEIGNLSVLEELFILGGILTGLPKEIGNLSNLKMFNIVGTQIAELPPEIGNLSNLEMLRVFGNPLLNELPQDLGRLTNLKKLVVGQASPISSLPSSLQNLTGLEELTIFNTLLTEVPIWIGSLFNLQKLIMTSGRFSTIPSEFGNLSNLKILDFSDGQLTEVPNELSNLTTLEFLDLRYNPVTEIPQAVCDLADANTEVLLDANDVCQ